MSSDWCCCSTNMGGSFAIGLAAGVALEIFAQAIV